ncbi:hypothetical protein [Falsiroseomonas oryziterrae]|uniref:hypothetical protein n=1 Tax=Falsiroseomonas oryziterrae TaxID=2911368 RepID=UPI001F23C7B7|nr:hypothetical protein [Roseomonas sp. NPKOSM-4]
MPRLRPLVLLAALAALPGCVVTADVGPTYGYVAPRPYYYAPPPVVVYRPAPVYRPYYAPRPYYGRPYYGRPPGWHGRPWSGPYRRW